VYGKWNTSIGSGRRGFERLSGTRIGDLRRFYTRGSAGEDKDRRDGSEGGREGRGYLFACPFP
jgi:hypothetical protein